MSKTHPAFKSHKPKMFEMTSIMAPKLLTIYGDRIVSNYPSVDINTHFPLSVQTDPKNYQYLTPADSDLDGFSPWSTCYALQGNTKILATLRMFESFNYGPRSFSNELLRCRYVKVRLAMGHRNTRQELRIKRKFRNE